MEKSRPIQGPQVMHLTSAGILPSTIPSWTVNYSQSFNGVELISSGSGRRTQNPCFHVRIRPSSVRAPVGTFNPSVFPTHWWRVSSGIPLMCPFLPDPKVFAGLPVPDPPSLKDVRDRITQPVFNDLLVFILELRDLPQLFKKVRDIPDLVLRKNLAVLPLISEIDQAVARINSFNSRIKALRSGIGKPIRFQFHSSDRLDRKFTFSSPGESNCTTRFQCDLKVTHSVYLRYSLDIPDLKNLLSFTAFLGGDLSLSTIWELIPLSFVVDYFIGVSEYLDQYSTNLANVQISDAYLISSAKGVGSFTSEGSLNYFSQDPKFSISGDFKVYQRYIRPLGTVYPSLNFRDGLSLRQLETLTALALR